MKRVLIAIGTRPELIKLAPVVREMRSRPEEFDVRVVLTGQHRELLDQMCEFFDLAVDADLEVMQPGQGLNKLMAKIMARFDVILDDIEPELVIAQGDTTTVLAAAMASYYRAIPFAHVEAGLRSGDLMSPFPEEGNRRAIGAVATWHFAPTLRAASNLLAEGIDPSRVFVTGNTVVDALLQTAARGDITTPEVATTPGKLTLITLHRRENFARLDGLLATLRTLAEENKDTTFVWPVHPNPSVRQRAYSALGDVENVRLIEPLDYGQFVHLMKRADLILTDSGGIQEEAPALGVPVLVLRDVTERPEGIEVGAAMLVGTNPQDVYKFASALLRDSLLAQRMRRAPSPYGDGLASKRIADVLETGTCASFQPTKAA